MRLRHLCRRWEESRGDHFDAWGASVWLFEIDESGGVVRQIEAYDAGPRLRYGLGAAVEDEYGGLSSAALMLGDFEGFEIDAKDFELAWVTGPWMNEPFT